MKKLVAVVLLAGCSSVAMAEVDYGVGLSLQNSDGVIHLPINISDTWRIEPSLRYVESERESAFSNSDTRYVELGVGVFKKKVVAEKVALLYGARVGYLESKYTYSSDGDSSSKENGYTIAPTLGVEYNIAENFSIGGEIALKYYDIDGSEDDFGDDEDTSEKYLSTQTGISVRYFF